MILKKTVFLTLRCLDVEEFLPLTRGYALLGLETEQTLASQKS